MRISSTHGQAAPPSRSTALDLERLESRLLLGAAPTGLAGRFLGQLTDSLPEILAPSDGGDEQVMPHAGSVELAAVAIAREEDAGPDDYSFFAVVLGDQIFSAEVVLPDSVTSYDLVRDSDEDFWYEVEGTEAQVTGAYPDGDYTIRVVFNNATVYQATATLGGSMPAYPVVTYPLDQSRVPALTPDIQWDQFWPTDDPTRMISVAVYEAFTDDEVAGTEIDFLPANATSFEVPRNVLSEGEPYEAVVEFIALSDAVTPWGGKLSTASTRFTPDVTPPRITGVVPGPGSVVAGGPNPQIVVSFSEPVADASVTPATFTVTRSGGDNSFLEGNEEVIAGTLVTDFWSATATFTPDDPPVEDRYRIRIDGTASVTDLAGSTLDGEFGGTFPSGDGWAGGTFISEFTVDASGQLVYVWASPGGVGEVRVWDVNGGGDIDPNDIAVRFGRGNTVRSITLGGEGAMDGLCITVAGVDSIGSIRDARRGPLVDVVFIASDAPIKTISLKTGLTGYNLDNKTRGMIDFPGDVGLTALYSTSAIGSVKLAGDVAGNSSPSRRRTAASTETSRRMAAWPRSTWVAISAPA